MAGKKFSAYDWRERCLQRQRRLFVAQGCQGIEFGGAMGGQETRQRGYRGQQDNSHYERQGIARLQAVEQRLGGLSRAQGEAR